MKTFAPTQTNDFAVTGRNLLLVGDAAGIALVARHCAQAILGEMVLAKQQGMPYFETVWVGAPTTAPFEAAFRERILAIEGVTNITELVTAQVGDAMRYEATIETIYGTAVING